MANLKETEFEQVVEYTIRDRNGDKTDAVFLLAGPGHPNRLKLEDRGWSRSARTINKHGKMHLDENWKATFDKATETLLAVTVGWRNVSNGSGEEIEFAEDAARAIYENRNSSVRAQVLEENQRIGSFYLSSSTT